MKTLCSKCRPNIIKSAFTNNVRLCKRCAKEVVCNIDEFIKNNGEKLKNNNILIIDEFNLVEKDGMINFRGRIFIKNLHEQLPSKNTITIVYSRDIVTNGPLSSSVQLEEKEINSKLKLGGKHKVDYVIPEFWIYSMPDEEWQGKIGDIGNKLILFASYIPITSGINRDISIYATDLPFEEETGFGLDEDYSRIKLFTANAPKIYNSNTISIRERHGPGIYEEYHEQFDTLEALKKFLKNKNKLQFALATTGMDGLTFDTDFTTYKTTSLVAMTESDYLWLTEVNTHSFIKRVLTF